jgi:tetratricopeptide (TPR) repeat protein
MPLDLTSQQLQQIESLGIKLNAKPVKGPDSKLFLPARHNACPHRFAKHGRRAKLSAWPILSISGLTLVSFGGIFLLKSKLSASVSPAPVSPLSNSQPTPTQVPKSIQHYLLTSQQFFTQALQAQQTQHDSNSALQNLNQSLLAASDAIKEFPDDYRGYEQRGRIYQSLLDSQPQLLTSAIADFSSAATRNPASASLARTLATLYARKGDASSTLNYLSLTINLDPTSAQNFYDLAHLQQQIGLIPQALSTYDRLLTIVSDPTQKQAVSLEKSTLEKLVSQNPARQNYPTGVVSEPSPSLPPISDSPLIQADSGTGLIIAAPETSTKVTVSNLSTSNSLSGDGTLPAGLAKITITNSNLTSSSQVYITTISGTKNVDLRLLSRSGTNFTVGLDSPATQDFTFKWWIVN